MLTTKVSFMSSMASLKKCHSKYRLQKVGLYMNELYGSCKFFFPLKVVTLPFEFYKLSKILEAYRFLSNPLKTRGNFSYSGASFHLNWSFVQGFPNFSTPWPANANKPTCYQMCFCHFYSLFNNSYICLT